MNYQNGPRNPQANRNNQSNRNNPRNNPPRRRSEEQYPEQDYPLQHESKVRGREYEYEDESSDYEPRVARRSSRPGPRQGERRANYGYAQPAYADSDDGYYAARPSNKKPWFIGLAVIAVAAVAWGAYALLDSSATVQIVGVSPAYQTSQKAYQDCHRVSTTNYVKNQKDGTEGALIGGATGAVAGGVVGNQIHGGGGGTAVGAIAGGVGGALIGRDIQRSNQPDYVAKKGHTTQCQTAYRPVQTQVGYNVSYLQHDKMATIVTQTAPVIGVKMPLTQLQSMAVPPQVAVTH